jgi:hypothetical protein
VILAMVSPVQLASVPPLEVAHRKDRIELGRVGRQPLDREPVAVAPRWTRILIAPVRADPVPPIRAVGVIAVVRQTKHSRALVPSGGGESETHYLCLSAATGAPPSAGSLPRRVLWPGAEAAARSSPAAGGAAAAPTGSTAPPRSGLDDLGARTDHRVDSKPTLVLRA